MHPIRVGCSGWNYQSWRGEFYPPGCPPSRWLERYATDFDTVEVNSTFYRLARRDAVARWVQQTPGGFVFTVKASRYMTHIKRLTCGSCPATSTATTSAWPARCASSRPAGTRSSSATPAGSSPTSCRCCASAARRS
jgi:uncharacterized protein YecE (DUF72 family)